MDKDVISLEEQWEFWRADRNKSLASGHGWLSLVAFTWISSKPGIVDNFPGLWWIEGQKVHAIFQAQDGVVRDDLPFEGEMSVMLEAGSSDTSISSGTRVAEIVLRGGRCGVRVRDSSSPVVTNFSGVPVYSYNPVMRVEGHFEPYEQIVEEAVATAHPDVVGTARIVGEVLFVLGNKCQRLKVQENGDFLQAIFFDPTNGQETARWRYVSFERPEGEGGRVVIDFNRSLNFPAAFTPFGTCPMPPSGNEIDVPVKAGERRP